MDEESNGIRVNFGRPMPLFPLNEAVLLPHGVLPLHIFEPRYRQMMKETLDGAGQFAMAVFEGEQWRDEYHGRPPLRPAVCVAQIVQHETLPDGRYNVIIQGVCRARIEDEEPGDAERLYRAAALAPIGGPDDDEQSMPETRERLRELLRTPPLLRFVDPQGKSLSESIATYLDREEDDAPTSVAIDLIGQYIIKQPRTRYDLLAESDPEARATIAARELEHVASLVRRAERQIDPDAPKGVTWN